MSMEAPVPANVTHDDSQQPGFLEEVSKDILIEAPPDSHRRPGPGDVVTARVAEGSADGVDAFYTWTVGSVASVSTEPRAFDPVIAGVDIDRLVCTMRRGERCSAKPKGVDAPAVLTVTLVDLERTEDITADGRLLRTTIREGAGWQVPRSGMELRVRFSWRHVALGRLPPASSEAACVICLAGESAEGVAESKELQDLRRDLSRGLSGSPPVITRILADSSPPEGPVVQISHGERELLNSTLGVSVAKASIELQSTLGAPRDCISSQAREVEMQVVSNTDAPSNSLEAEAVGDIVCTAEDWLPGFTGRVAISDLRVGQHCFVRVQPELAFGAAGLHKYGILPDSALEYEIELLQIMTTEDVSLEKNKTVLKKVTKEGESYEKPTEGREVTVTIEAHDGCSGAVLLEEQKLVFLAASGKFCSALEETVLTMKKGEVCEVRCSSPADCTDAELALSPSADADVVLRLEMHDFEKVSLYSSSDAERVEHCIERKEVGAKFFKEGKWLRALKRYHHVVSLLSYLDHWKDEGLKTQAVAIRRLCNLNVAACHLKQKSWSDAEKACTAVLREEPDNVKALFRRASAMKELAEYCEAEQNLRRVLELDKENKEARIMLVDIKRFVKSEVAQQKKMFSKMLAGSGRADPAEKAASAVTQNAAASADTGRARTSIPQKTPSDDFADEEDSLENSLVYIAGASALLAVVAAFLYFSKKKSA